MLACCAKFGLEAAISPLPEIPDQNTQAKGMDDALETTTTKTPLRDDPPARRILGDTVVTQEGDAVFELIEQVRQASIRFPPQRRPQPCAEEAGADPVGRR